MKKTVKKGKKVAITPKVTVVPAKRVSQAEILQNIHKEFDKNPLLWGKWVCAHYFRIQSPPFHLKVLRESITNRFFAVAAPRESSKSTILSFLTPLHAICFKKKHFIIILTNTYSKSCGALRGIKQEFHDNKRIKEIYKVEVTKDSEGDAIFRHKDGFEVRVLCKGHEQMGPIRGERFGAWRPDLIIVDDLEDDELVKNPDRRRDLQDKFDEAVLPACDFQTGQVIVIGTILHDDALMKKLVSKGEYPQFRKLLYKARHEGQSLWKEKWTLEQLNLIEKTKPSVFAKEYQNNPVYGELAKFHRDDFRYWRIEYNDYILYDAENRPVGKGALSSCRAAIACDLAWEERRKDDFTVIIPALLTPQNDILVETYIHKRGMRPHEIEEILFTMDDKFRALTKSTVPIGFEKAMLEKVMKHLLKQAMRKRNKWLLFKNLQWDTDKISRIETRLEPRYAQHSIFHRHDMGELERQLLRFPSGIHDDLCLVGDTIVPTLFGNKKIQDIRVGDFVITPDGIRKVVAFHNNGYKKVISNMGLVGTPNHPVVDTVKGIDQLSDICYTSNISNFTEKENWLWKYKSLLNSMEKATNLWVGKENIILVSQRQIVEGKILKDFMLRFGNFIIKKKFLKGMLFTTRIGTLLITHHLIWNVYRINNTLNSLNVIWRKINCILNKLDLLQPNGIGLKKVMNGIKYMAKSVGLIRNIKPMSVYGAVALFSPEIVKHRDFAVTTIQKTIAQNKDITHKKENVLYAKKNLQSKYDGLKQNVVPPTVQPYTDTKLVYNITVNKSHLYYANNILVGNCDGLQGVVQLLQNPKHTQQTESTDTHFDWLRKQAQHAIKPPKKPFVWGGKSKQSSIPASVSWV